MRRILPAMALCALFFSEQAAAAAPEFQITPRAGFGNLRVDAFQGVNEDAVIDTDTLGMGVGIGFLTPVGFVAEIGADSFGDFDFFDSFDSFSLTQQFASVGWQIELGEGWRVVPRAGRARWKLRSEEGRFLNPGPELTREVRGYNYFWEVGVSRRISKVVTLGVNYKQGSYEFGRTRSTAFVVTLGF